MVKYSKGDIPNCLLESKVQEAFKQDCLAKDYVDKNSRYKCKYTKNKETFYPIATALKDIYKNKCAYCETAFNRSYIKIEHYRPKSVYYALAYSWTNLLPICDICNTIKSDNFEIDGVNTKDIIRTLDKLHYSAKVFNRIEKPKFLHPEIDNYEAMFRFNTKGKIVVYPNITNSHRMRYTIKNANLNEEDLMERRAKILKDFINIKDEVLSLFLSAIKHKDNEELEKFKSTTKTKLAKFFNDENEFIAVRKYIIKRLRFFLARCDEKFVKFFNRYLRQYIKTVEVYHR